METINERFRALRQACNMSQTEFGEVLGISCNTVSLIENGKKRVTQKHLEILESWPEKRINMEWLKTGNGDSKFLPGDTIEERLEPLKKEFGLNETQFKLLTVFLSLPKASRDIISDYLEQCFGYRISEKNTLPTSEKELAEKYVIKDVDEENA